MLTTMFSILLAGAGLGSGEHGYGPDPLGGGGGGYGGYGSYGSYGGYASYPGWHNNYAPRTWITPYCVPGGNFAPGAARGPGAVFGPGIYGQLPSGHLPGQLPAAVGSDVAKKEHEFLDKRFTELKTILNIYEQKIRGLEQKLEEQNTNAETQGRILEILDRKLADTLEKSQARIVEVFDRKLADSHAKILEKVAAAQETQVKIVQETRIVEEKIRKDVENGVAEQVKVLSTRLDERLRQLEEKLIAAAAAANKQEASPASLEANKVLENRIALLEQQLKIGEQIRTGLDTIGNKLGSLDRRSPDATVSDPAGGQLRSGVPFNRGLIVVSLPADARLFLDNLPSAVGANLRSFISPELEVGKNYFYTVRVEVERGGKTLTESQRVYFQPGREVRVSFDHIETSVVNVQGNATGQNAQNSSTEKK